MSGQPLTGPSGLLVWHPRDVDTLQEHYDELAEQAELRRLDSMRALVLGTQGR